MDLDIPLQGTKMSSSKSRIVTSKRTVRYRDTAPHQPKVSACTSSSANLNGTRFFYTSHHSLWLIICPDENIPPIEFRTPSAARFRDALAPVTPKHRVRLPGKPTRQSTQMHGNCSRRRGALRSSLAEMLKGTSLLRLFQRLSQLALEAASTSVGHLVLVRAPWSKR
jgi:hypothetical protein